MPRQHKSSHPEGDGYPRLQKRKDFPVKRKTKATTAEESLSNLVGRADMSHKSHKNCKNIFQSEQEDEYRWPLDEGDESSGFDNTRELQRPRHSWRRTTSANSSHSHTQLRQRSEPPVVGTAPSPSFMRKSANFRRRKDRLSTQGSSAWPLAFERLGSSSFLGLAGWTLIMVVLALLVLIAWTIPFLRSVWRFAVIPYSIRIRLADFTTAQSTQLNRFNLPSYSTLCGMPVLSHIVDCNPNSEVHPSESLSGSIALLADDPGEWIRTCRLLETLPAHLSSYAETEDQIIDLTLELEFHDVEVDLLLRRVARSSSSIVDVYEKLRGRKWYNSLPPIVHWLFGDYIGDGFRRDVKVALDAWTHSLTELSGSIQHIKEICNSTREHAEALKSKALVVVNDKKPEQGLWLWKTKFTTNEEHARQIVNKHIKLLDALSQTHNLLESTAKDIDTINHRLNRAKARILDQLRKVVITSSTRTRLNGEIIEEFREVVGVTDHTRRDRDALRVATEEELDGKTVIAESRRVY
ncbi:hypothetical protein D6C92_06316 [Aureobasidium pullulans]|uniref:Uncharacterized protein n=1 Tax=Aureobasidium pullulans TaxID=5580 RepID=A0A4S9R167_AURPU|nr:hypothetical protein D6D28_08125 [Aureobasidium pullulans]THY91359.1 hypothetical protein D6C92_06316 [Aureobasidium pullulans]